MNTFALLVQALIGKQYQCVIRYISYALQTLLKTNKSQCCPDFPLAQMGLAYQCSGSSLIGPPNTPIKQGT